MTAGTLLSRPHAGRRLALGAGLLLAAAAMAFLPLRELALLAAAVAGGLLVLRWPWLILLPLAALLPVTAGMRLGPASVTDLLLAGAAGLWFIDGARRRTLPLHGSPVIAAVTLYAGVLIAAAWGAANFGEAAREVIKWSELLVLLLVAPALLQRAQPHASANGPVAAVAAALLLGAAAQASLGLYQFIFAVGPEYFVVLGRFMRAYGSFGQPNPFGGYLGLCLPVALSLLLWGWQEVFRGEAPRARTTLWAVFYTAATVLIGAGLLASWSRGAWLGAAAGILAVLVLRSRLAAVVSGIALLLLLGGLLLGAFSPTLVPQPVAARLAELPAYFGLTDVMKEPVTDENFSVLERLAHWVAAERMWAQAPWLGVGPGNYAEVYPQVRLPQWEDALGHAHNVYLNVAAETGLIGLAAYLGLVVTTFVFVWRRRGGSGTGIVGMRHGTDGAAIRANTVAERWRGALMVGILGVLVHLTVHNVVDNLYVQGMVLLVGLWLALAHVRITEQARIE
jgi:O-antigen ligase